MYMKKFGTVVSVKNQKNLGPGPNNCGPDLPCALSENKNKQQNNKLII